MKLFSCPGITQPCFNALQTPYLTALATLVQSTAQRLFEHLDNSRCAVEISVRFCPLGARWKCMDVYPRQRERTRKRWPVVYKNQSNHWLSQRRNLGLRSNGINRPPLITSEAEAEANISNDAV